MHHTSPTLDSERLERALGAARIVGAALALGLGPIFPNIGMPFVVGLAAVLIFWSFAVRQLVRRARSAAAMDRLARLGFAVDSAIVVYAMWVFAADPGWTTWTVGMLLIIGSAFRFGRLGALISAALLSIAYLAIVLFRNTAYGFDPEPQRVAFHVSVYLLCALLMTGTLRELYELREQREYQALHDPLTALPNRALLTDRLAQAITAAGSATSTSLLMLELRSFKEINDSFGHDAGDVVLRDVGIRLRSEVRPQDTVARFGADEFAVLLPETDWGGSARMARRLLKALERPFLVAGQTLDIGAAIGIVVAPRQGEDPQKLLARADIAMYAAKSSLDGYVLYDDAHDHRGIERLAMLSDLRHALEREELTLHYQPLVSLSTGELLAVEALTRWRHPRHGLLSPASFIPLAENSDLIKPLTHAVLNQSLRQMRAWRLSGLVIPVAVNLSARNLLDPEFPDLVAELLAHWQADPSHLRLEITESVLMADPERALQSLERLRELGVRIALDDFGTGFSSLAYLHSLPLDEVKIDKSFVAGLSTTDSSVTIVRATVDLGHGLGYAVVAEGVEDEHAWNKLSALGCDTAQGFHVARPMPSDDLTRWVVSRLAVENH